MSRSVAGFTIFLFICVVSGQQYSSSRVKVRPTDDSIHIGVISGGDYSAGSFSIGHGGHNNKGDAGPGGHHGVNSGQRYPTTGSKGPDNSIAIPVISGGNYAAGSFSIGYGGNKKKGDAGPGVHHGVNSYYGQIYSNTGQGHYFKEEGFVNGQNEGSKYGQNYQNGANNYDITPQNPTQKPTNPYEDNYNKPVENPVSRFNFLSEMFNNAFSWFY